MQNKLLKHVIIFGVLVMILAPAFILASTASAQRSIDEVLGLNYASNLDLPNSSQDPRDQVVSIVTYIMTFLALVAVVIILIGGFRWMTANGNQDRIESAKKTIIAGAIGLIIVIAAFTIITYVIRTTTNLINTGSV